MAEHMCHWADVSPHHADRSTTRREAKRNESRGKKGKIFLRLIREMKNHNLQEYISFITWSYVFLILFNLNEGLCKILNKLNK